MQAKKSVLLLTTLLTVLSSSFIYAKVLNLYDQPQSNAKVIGSIESSEGMVPIFTSKDNEWMKVGDPKNGNVGWIQTKDLSDTPGSLSTAVSVSQQTINTSSGPKTVQAVKFATPKTLTPAENTAAMKQAQQRQLQIQQSVQKMMQSFYKQMSDYYQANPALFNDPLTNMPMMMPIIVFPPEEMSSKKTK